MITKDKDKSPKQSHKSSIVCNPTRAIANNPTHLTLTTKPIDMPEAANQKNHSTEKGLLINNHYNIKHTRIFGNS